MRISHVSYLDSSEIIVQRFMYLKLKKEMTLYRYSQSNICNVLRNFTYLHIVSIVKYRFSED